MFEEFVKWMATLPEWERDQQMEILINFFAPSPAHEDFHGLKGALKRKEKRVKQLEAENSRLIEKLKKLSKNQHFCQNSCNFVRIQTINIMINNILL